MAHYVVKWQNKELPFDPVNDITRDMLKAIKKAYPDIGSFQKWTTALQDQDPDAITSLVWAARRKAGESIPDPSYVVDFPIMRFLIDDLDWVPDPESEAGDEEDPLPESGEADEPAES